MTEMAERPYDWRERDPEWGDKDPDWRMWVALVAAAACLVIAMYLLWTVGAELP